MQCFRWSRGDNEAGGALVLKEVEVRGRRLNLAGLARKGFPLVLHIIKYP